VTAVFTSHEDLCCRNRKK